MLNATNGFRFTNAMCDFKNSGSEFATNQHDSEGQL
jgi:hypothetical protein